MGNLCSIERKSEATSPGKEKSWSIKIHGVELVCSLGQIWEDDSEALVYPADYQLTFSSGTPASLLNKGGAVIQDEAKKQIQEFGELKPGDSCVTSAGQLKAKFIFHAVCPTWAGGDKNEISILENLIKSCLNKASDRALISIAFSPLSGGVYGFPKERAISIFIEQCIKFAKENQENPYSLLKTIKFVVLDNFMSNYFKEECMKQASTKVEEVQKEEIAVLNPVAQFVQEINQPSPVILRESEVIEERHSIHHEENYHHHGHEHEKASGIHYDHGYVEKKEEIINVGEPTIPAYHETKETK